MRRIIYRIFPLLSIAVIAIGLSCSNEECYENKNSLPLAGFYSSGEDPKAVSLDSISIYGVDVPGDSILQDSVRGLSKSYLPFRIDQNSTKYVIQYLSGIAGILRVRDTITFNYEIVPYFVSAACGAIYEYKMTSIQTTHYYIDSVTCPLKVIDNRNIENLKIYFRVQAQ